MFYKKRVNKFTHTKRYRAKIYFIGIDVSKEKLDLCLYSSEKILKEWILSNTVSAINRYFNNLQKEYGVDASDFLVCAEHTGQYTYPLACACNESGIDLWLESPAQIKHKS